MAILRTILLVSACLLSQVLSSPAHNIHRRATDANKPLPPSIDPWYTAPDNFACQSPGAILRIRPAPGNLTSIFANSSAAYNILFRTTDSQYKPTWAVTTVIIPKNPAPALLSYQIPYDSAFLDASPSYQLYNSKSISAAAGVSAGNASLAKGWFVSIPDYEGPLASFTAGVMSGHATIDSVRAVFAAKDFYGLDKDAKYAMWGYSGGALASEWAAELQVQYAPELNFSGAALGGLTPNTSKVLLTINKGPSAGLAPSGILGLLSQYPDLEGEFFSRLKTSGPYNRTGFLAAKNLTLEQSSVAFAGQDIGAYFVNGITDLTTPPASTITYRDGIMGFHGIPQMPLYVYKAIGDLTSHVNDTDDLVNKFCQVGANILYERNTVGGHAADATNGFFAAFAFLNATLGGTYAQSYQTSGCTIRDVTVNITSSPS